jgi:hypothetical protein
VPTPSLVTPHLKPNFLSPLLHSSYNASPQAKDMILRRSYRSRLPNRSGLGMIQSYGTDNSFTDTGVRNMTKQRNHWRRAPPINRFASNFHSIFFYESPAIISFRKLKQPTASLIALDILDLQDLKGSTAFCDSGRTSAVSGARNSTNARRIEVLPYLTYLPTYLY